MEWIFGFVFGFLADVFRSVFLPASTTWLNRFIPSSRKKANIEENALTLGIMERLKELGKDPNLAKFAREDSETFLNVLTNQKEAYVDNIVEAIESEFMSQVEMNAEAARLAGIAEQQMQRALDTLRESNLLVGEQCKVLEETQTLWEKFAQSQARFAASQFEGGSMAPLVYAAELEIVTVSRTGELKRMLQEIRELDG